MLSNQHKAVDSWLFLRKFMQYGTRVASVSPSSRQLAQEVCAHIDPTRPQTILELGAGTGAVTAVAIERMHPDSLLLAVEVDPDFAAVLARRCPAAHIIEADATTTHAHLEALGISHVDVVISGLPTPSLPSSVTRPIFRCLYDIARESYVSQITVIPWLYLSFYRRFFEEVTFKPVWWNIPCGGVYHCRVLRDDVASRLSGKPG